MDFTTTIRRLGAALVLALPAIAFAQAPANVQAVKPEAIKPQAAPAPATAPAAAAAAPAASPAAPAAKEEDLQSNEAEIAKARAAEEETARKKAAADAAAERQRQKEARLALCVIKPVMTDDEIELCRVAYQEK